MCKQKFFRDYPTEYVLCLCRIRKKGCCTAHCAAAFGYLILFFRRENAQNSSVMKGRFSLGMETVVVTAST